MTLPKFQRGYVWSREQIRKLFSSLYRRHPVGGLIIWTTESEGVQYRGSGNLPPGVVNLLLDGQQRVTTLYGVIRGDAPRFFDGNPEKFKGLHFNLETEEFEFYQPVKMRDDARWINVTTFMQAGNDGISAYFNKFNNDPNHSSQSTSYLGKLNLLLGIRQVDIPEQAITGSRELDEIVEIFNEVNTGGTKLSKGDLALARICADWPEARDMMKNAIDRWSKAGYNFTLDWLLRSVNTVLTNNAEFRNLNDKNSDEIKRALQRAIRHIDTWLNRVGGRLGLDHDRVLFGRYTFPVLARYSEGHTIQMSAEDADKLLFWVAQSGMWGRYSSSSETVINQDLRAIDREGNPIDNLLETLRLWRGSLRVEPGNFDSATLGARFYPVLYMLTRMAEAKDLCSGLPLKKGLLGHMNQLEVHHIFPKSKLYDNGFQRKDVNALANFCLQTKECNLQISNRHPEEYLREYEQKNPGVLKSQWIPQNPELWKMENYLQFLAARRELLADATNELMLGLLHGDERWLRGPGYVSLDPSDAIPGGIADEDEQELIQNIKDWISSKGLAEGILDYYYTDPETGRQTAVFDLAWPDGLQEGLSQPVAVLHNENEVMAVASKAGFRHFTTRKDFENYVRTDILTDEE